MTTPDTTETLEQIAERIAKQHAPAFYQGALSRDILSALRNERERAATIALEQRCERGTPWDAACVAIAQAIREGGARKQ